MQMTRALILFVLAVLVALPVVREAQAQARRAVVIGMALEPPVLDPTINAAAAIAEITQLNIYEGLTRIDEQGRVLPGLAERWEVSPDARTYTFHLRRGVKFSDGTDFDSGDVKFTFERNAREGSTNSRRSYFTQMERIATPDATTVVVTLQEPSALFLFNLAENASVIVAPESAETNRQRPVGTGPYVLERWLPGDSVVLAKNPAYRAAASVSIERVTFKFIGDGAAQVAALLAGDVDFFPNLSAVEAVGQFQRDARFQALIGSTEGETILAINNKRGPLADVRVRRALSHAVDRREVIVGAMSGLAQPIGSHFAPHHPAYVDLTGTYAPDLDRARALLRETGFANGFEVTLTLPPVDYARRSGQIVAAQLARVGVRARIEEVEWARWLDGVYTQKNYDLTIVSHVEPMDVVIYGNPNYYFQYDSPALRDILARANRATDEAEQNRAWADAQRKITEDAVNVFLFELPKVAVARAGLKGLWTNSPMFINDVAAMRWE
jgi:peptide/nickel transport system substrate-binding protein